MGREKQMKRSSLDQMIFTHTQWGNSKLPKSTAIFNMGPAHKCPSRALGLCTLGDDCYAFKAEIQYADTCIPYRIRQMAIWKLYPAISLAYAFLDAFSRKRHKIKMLRLNESGDFWGQECVDKAEKIARKLAERGIITYAYTHRSDLDFSNIKALYLRGSNFKREELFGSFETIEEDYVRQACDVICPADCTDCTLCVDFPETILAYRH